jgi:hypothetical protein
LAADASQHQQHVVMRLQLRRAAAAAVGAALCWLVVLLVQLHMIAAAGRSCRLLSAWLHRMATHTDCTADCIAAVAQMCPHHHQHKVLQHMVAAAYPSEDAAAGSFRGKLVLQLVSAAD